MSLKHLKPFQRATVKHALRRLRARGSSRRFLVADEVGLGKTLVAQGVIQQLCRRVKGHVNVFYVCSSLSISHQNRDNLLEFLEPEERKRSQVEVDRLTLLPKSAPDLTTDFTLFTLTPGTMPGRGGYRPGQRDERALIYHLLTTMYPGFGRGYKISHALRHSVRPDRWDLAVARLRRDIDLRAPRGRRLVRAFKQQLALQLGFSRRSHKKTLAAPLRDRLTGSHEAQMDVIERLRIALGIGATENLRPDLVILDEFQRFFDILETTGELADDADRDTRADTLMSSILSPPDARNGGPMVLLLSATPYPLYSGWSDGGGRRHLESFRQLLHFLYGPGGASHLDQLDGDLREYGQRLRTDTPGSPEVLEVRDRVNRRLSLVMARTERLSAGAQSSEDSRTEVHESPIEPLDIRVFRHLAESAAPEHVWMVEPFWSSIPFPLQMMDRAGYKLAERAKPQPLTGRARQVLVQQKTLRGYRTQALPHPRLRALFEDATADRLALPWLPPSLPWWPLAGIFEGLESSADDSNNSKVLLFSRYRAVPRAISATFSYEAERHTMTHAFAPDRGAPSRAFDYFHRDGKLAKGVRPAKSHRPQPTRSFQFAGAKAEKRLGLVPMFLPCPALAAAGDPLLLRGAGGRRLTRQKAQNRVIERLARTLGVAQTASANRPLWRWVSTLENRVHGPDGLQRAWEGWLTHVAGSKRAARVATRFLGEDPYPEHERPTRGELRKLADLALAGPAQVLLRAASRVFHDASRALDLKRSEDRELLDLVADVAMGSMRGYLDQPEFHVLFSQSARSRHTEAVRRVIWEGNLESVLDEYLTTLSGLGAARPAEGRQRRAFDALDTALSIRTASVDVNPLVNRRKLSMRCHAAMPFGMSPKEVQSESTGLLRSDFLRIAFNSPFRPYVLSTTSIGQEGLDFHVYCDHVVHWDLPHNPVDLEQREGRIQRYGSLAVRKAMARTVKRLPSDRYASPWQTLAARFARKESKDGLQPWWEMPGARIRRTIYAIPLSAQQSQLNVLQKSLSLYRYVLGQADQEALIEALRVRIEESNNKEAEVLHRWLDTARINLSPYFSRMDRE